MYLINFELLKGLEIIGYHLEIGNLEKKIDLGATI
jgi:hypothetical protein